ncbi:MAG: putative prokaryotic signal transducing protein [Planctomycetota bacterium]
MDRGASDVADPRDTVVIARFPDELSALLLVGDLEAEGIPATVLGGLTAQLRAEAPGLVSVLVRRGDLVRAERLIAERAPPPGWEDEAEAAAREGEDREGEDPDAADPDASAPDATDPRVR